MLSYPGASWGSGYIGQPYARDHRCMAGIDYDLPDLIRPSARSALVDWAGGLIDVKPSVVRDAFADAGIVFEETHDTYWLFSAAQATAAQKLTGERNDRTSLMEDALRAIDMAAAPDVSKFCEVLETLLLEAKGTRRKAALTGLRAALAKDGFSIDVGCNISMPDTTRLANVDLSEVVDASALAQQIGSILRNYHRNPEEAAGRIKSLVESGYKIALAHHGKSTAKGQPDLKDLHGACKPLLLRLFDECGTPDKQQAKGMAGALLTITQTAANIRNADSLDHGSTTAKSIDPRMLRLMLDAALTVLNVLLDVIRMEPDTETQTTAPH